MEAEIQIEITKNWSNLKVNLAGKQNEIKDLLVENRILLYDDMVTYYALSTPTDMVEMMVRTVMERNKCALFVDILEKVGYDKLCKDIRKSVFVLYSKSKKHTEEETACSLKDDQELDQLEAMKLFYQERDKEREAKFEKRDKEREDKLEKRDKEREDKLEKRDTEREAKWEKRDTDREAKWEKRDKEREEKCQRREEEMYQTQIATTKDVNILKEQYKNLQDSYKKAREKLDKMTKLAKEKQLKIVKLEQDLKKIQELLRSSDSDKQDSTVIQDRKKEITKLKKNIAQQNQEMETVQEEKKSQEEDLSERKSVIDKKKETIDSLQKDNEDLGQINGKEGQTRRGIQIQKCQIKKKVNSPRKGPNMQKK